MAILVIAAAVVLVVYVLYILPWIAKRIRNGATLPRFLAWLPTMLCFVLPLFTSRSAALSWSLIVIPLPMRAADIAFDKVPDSGEPMRRHLLYKIGFLLLPDFWCPKNAEESKENRKAGFISTLWMLGSGALVFGLDYLSKLYCREIMENRVLSHLFWFFYVGIQVPCSLALVFSLVPLITGLKLARVYNSPFLSTSPREFWSRRWNMLFRNNLHRHVFLPICGLGKKEAQESAQSDKAKPKIPKWQQFIAAMAVFAVSGILHEYLTWISFEPEMYARFAGNQLLFFLLQGLACFVIPSNIGVIGTILWLICSSPLFISAYRTAAGPLYADTKPQSYYCYKP
ncbi:hypothetical protein Pelo_15747 [Pelomyxa schiedti]|nr:hypothetical protein Pelo_15747 [Pelomyxa schiedti]